MWKFLSYSRRAKPTPVPIAPVIESVSDEPVQGVTFTNADNLSAARWPASVIEEPITLLTCFDIEALVRQERGLAASLDCRLPYPAEVLRSKLLDYKVPKFQKYDALNGNSNEHIVRFLESMDQHSHDIDLYLKEFSRSLIDRVYTWYVNLKPSTIRDRTTLPHGSTPSSSILKLGSHSLNLDTHVIL